MAINVKLDFSTRTKILLGVAALALAGVLAWFLHFGEEPTPPPRPVAKAPAKPAAPPAPVAVAPVAAAPGGAAPALTPVAAPAKPAAETPKPAAEAPKPPAEPKVAAKPAPAEAAVAPRQPARKSRRHEDARACLEQPDNAAIIKCAEAYL